MNMEVVPFDESCLELAGEALTGCRMPLPTVQGIFLLNARMMNGIYKSDIKSLQELAQELKHMDYVTLRLVPGAIKNHNVMHVHHYNGHRIGSMTYTDAKIIVRPMEAGKCLIARGDSLEWQYLSRVPLCMDLDIWLSIFLRDI
jgi:hypothetical protein